jgi:glycosyltransferase involved in cell wall biosynthesis
MEVIVINDGSKDDSQKVIDSYVEKYPGIFKGIEQENQGIGATRNNGIDIATGKYIMFIDNDDFIDKDYINTFVNYVLKDDLDVVIAGYRRVDDNKTLFSVSLDGKYEWSKYVSIAPWGKIYKKEFLDKNNIRFMITPIGEDVYFNLKVNTISNKIKVIDYIGYNWYYNGKSVTNTINDKIKNIDVISLLNEHYGAVKNNLNDSNIDIITMYFGELIIQFNQWYCKKTSYKEISGFYDKTFKWFDEHFPNNKKVKYIRLSKGDRKKNRFIIGTFMTARKLHLVKLLIYLYGRI